MTPAKQIKHGTTAGYLQCHDENRRRCERCRRAMRTATKRRALMRSKGWKPFIDSQPVRWHVAELVRAGMAWAEIAELSGTSATTIRDQAAGAHPSIRAETASKILAIPVPKRRTSTASLEMVDATGTRRRVQGMYWRGFPTLAMVHAFGMAEATISKIALGKQSRVTRQTHAKVAEVYRRWHDKEPCWHGVTAAQEHRARAYARRKGFAPPGAWEDIDDPHAVPDLPTGTRTRRTVQVAEDVEFLRATTGDPNHLIAQRLGMSPGILRLNLKRARRSAQPDREPAAV